MDYKIPIPLKSQKAFEAYQGKPDQNAGLIFERFAPDTQGDAKVKEKGLQAVLDAFGKSDKKLLEEWNARWERLVRAAEAEPFSMKTDWRLIAGLGKKGAFEVGFTFHRYGFPYLPGSSLKGLARAYGLLEIASLIKEDNLKTLRNFIASKINKKTEELGLLSALDYALSLEDEKECESHLNSCQSPDDAKNMAKAFRHIFGTTEHSGHVVFFDAMPESLPKLDMDIMNPHYPKYYEGSEFPTNWQSPIPVKFLTVASSSPFRFAIGWRSAPIDSISLETITPPEKQKEWNWFKGITQTKPLEKTNDLIKQAQEWLKNGLLELGTGGKTNAGYGYFKDVN